MGTAGKETARDRLVAEGLALVARKYGSGLGDGETPRGYHNAAHARDVVRNVGLLLAEPEGSGLPEEDRFLLPIAAAWHDAVHERDREDNESRSAALLRSAALRARLGRRLADRAAGLVLATRAGIGSPGSYRLVQAARDGAGCLLCDADVGYWGLPWEEFAPRWQGLACEVAGLPGGPGCFAAMSPADIGGFLRYQAELLGNHRFLTAAAERLWGEGRDGNARRSREGTLAAG